MMPFTTRLTLMRWRGPTFSDTELPPQVPQPSVSAMSRPVERPVPPWVPPVLIRMREAGFTENLRTMSLLSVWMLMVWPMPFWSSAIDRSHASSQLDTV